MDMKSAFLNGDLHDEIYMEHPHGPFEDGISQLVYKLKSLYGLKQTPRYGVRKLINSSSSSFSRCHSHNKLCQTCQWRNLYPCRLELCR
jgi:hypothetical protein